jgi:hypothetical protein
MKPLWPLALALLILQAPAQADDSVMSIDQSGNANGAAQTQSGTPHLDQMTLSQSGDGNQSSQWQHGEFGFNARNRSAVEQSGNANVASTTQYYAIDSVIEVVQSGDRNRASATIGGSNRFGSIVLNQSGNDNGAFLSMNAADRTRIAGDQSGSSNFANVTLHHHDDVSEFSQSGSSNSFTHQNVRTASPIVAGNAGFGLQSGDLNSALIQQITPGIENTGAVTQIGSLNSSQTQQIGNGNATDHMQSGDGNSALSVQD